jgi:Tfp pilus assembly protein FimT
VIVLTVAGILLSIVMPRIDVARFQMDAAAQEVGATMGSARGQAILRQHDYVLMFDASLDEYFVLEDANNNGQTDSGEERRTVELPGGVTFGLGAASPLLGLAPAISFTKTKEQLPALTFHRNGATSEEGVVYLTSLRASYRDQGAGDTRAILVERATGRARCFTYTVSVWKEGC